MQITGTVVQINASQTGQNKAGTAWRKQEVILETEGQYPKKVAVSIWGERIDKFALGKGETVTLHYDLESREYNGRWYTEVKAHNVERQSNGGARNGTTVQNVAKTFDAVVDGQDDDLPF